jgi:hypothetical protein
VVVVCVYLWLWCLYVGPAPPAEALADAHVTRALAAPLAVGEGVEVGFLVGLARADVAAAHERGGCPVVEVFSRRRAVLVIGLLMASLLWVVFLRRGAGRGSLHRLAVRVENVYVDCCPLPLARWEGDDLAGRRRGRGVVEQVAMMERLVSKDTPGGVCGTMGAEDGMISAGSRGHRDQARIQGYLVGVVVSPPLLGRLHRRRFLGDRRHG